jgi:hypothetical protein
MFPLDDALGEVELGQRVDQGVELFYGEFHRRIFSAEMRPFKCC